jgi:hypothetical protein
MPNQAATVVPTEATREISLPEWSSRLQKVESSLTTLENTRGDLSGRQVHRIASVAAAVAVMSATGYGLSTFAGRVLDSRTLTSQQATVLVALLLGWVGVAACSLVLFLRKEDTWR